MSTFLVHAADMPGFVVTPPQREHGPTVHIQEMIPNSSLVQTAYSQCAGAEIVSLSFLQATFQAIELVHVCLWLCAAPCRSGVYQCVLSSGPLPCGTLILSCDVSSVPFVLQVKALRHQAQVAQRQQVRQQGRNLRFDLSGAQVHGPQRQQALLCLLSSYSQTHPELFQLRLYGGFT